MKKKFFSLLAIMALVVPFGAHAMNVRDSFTTKDCKSNTENGFTTYTCPLYVEKYENAEENKIQIDFSDYGSAVTKVECSTNETDGFVYVDNEGTEGNAKCVFKNDAEVTKTTILVGNLVYTVEDAKVDSDHKNCGLSYSLGAASGKINPNTGVELPYGYIAGALALACGVVFVTTKKTKLFRI